MKKILIVPALMLMLLLQGCITTTTSVSGSSSISDSKIRNHARFLTDRMAYELDFTPMQYDDCFEINYDFIYYVTSFMPDVVLGYYDAINSYYRYLDYRNDDLRYIMTARQYASFMSKPYFYRPIYTSASTWNFRIYTIYSNHSFYYYDAPVIFKSYRGNHSRTHYTSGYYGNRYNPNDRFMGDSRILGSQTFRENRRNDFGSNLRDRNQKPDYNNYKNRNADNRTTDPRYRDSSGNQNSPLINNRTSGGTRQGSGTVNTTTDNSRTQSSRGNNTSSSRGNNTSTTSQPTTQPTTQSDTRTGNSSRGNSSTGSSRGGTRGGGTTTRQ